MDYLKMFIKNSKAYLESKRLRVPTSILEKQKKYEFEQELKAMFKELSSELSEQAEKWADLAFNNGYLDIVKLRSDLKNSILTILREFEEEQRENSGLYPD